MGQIAKAKAAALSQPTPQNAIQGLLANNWERIEAVMPRHMSSERLYQLAVSAINTTPKLAQCSAPSILSCVMKCSALGLEPSAVDGLGRAYILPYRSKNGMQAQLIIGYRGMLDLARRSGQIKSIEARAVYEGDEFEYAFGLEEKLVHVPSGKVREKGEKPTHVYTIARFINGGKHVEVMSLAEVEAVRARSKSGGSNSSPWVTDFEAMAKKTVVRRAFPYLPVSIEASGADVADEGSGGFESLFEAVQPAEPSTYEPQGMRMAVCTSCGTEFETGAADDLKALEATRPACCEMPSYEWKEQ